MRNFDYLYLNLYLTKYYKKLILWKHSIRLDGSNKIPLNYKFSNSLVAIYKTSIETRAMHEFVSAKYI